jgi:hypothetical protein
MMVEFKIATIEGPTAEVIEKAMADTGCLLKFKTENDTRILDVYIDIEDWRKELIKEWAQNKKQTSSRN